MLFRVEEGQTEAYTKLNFRAQWVEGGVKNVSFSTYVLCERIHFNGKNKHEGNKLKVKSFCYNIQNAI